MGVKLRFAEVIRQLKLADKKR